MTILVQAFILVWATCAHSEEVCEPGKHGDSCIAGKGDDPLDSEVPSLSLLQSQLEKTRVKVHEFKDHIEEKQGEQDAQQSLALMQGNKTKGCSWCFCFITSAAQCGADWVTSAAKCGTSAVTSAAQCGTSVITSAAKCGTSAVRKCSLVQEGAEVEKSEGEQSGGDAAKVVDTDDADVDNGEDQDQEDDGEHEASDDSAEKDGRALLTQRGEEESAGRRRRRRRGIGTAFKRAVKTVTCWTENIAKSCNVAKKCNVANKCQSPKSCDVAESFGDCYKEIKKSISDSDFMDLINDCNSIDACEKKVKKGLSGAWNAMKNAISSSFKSIVEDVEDGLPDEVKDLPVKVYNGVGTVIDNVGSTLTKVGDTFEDFFSDYEKLDLGDVCATGEKGFWYMLPTDCGAFSAMGKIFTSGQPETHFKSTGKKFKECVQKKGLLNFPTPFLELKFMDFCLPDFIKTPLEYLLGAFKFAADKTVDLVNEISDVVDQIQSFVQDELKLSLLGKAVGMRRALPDKSHHEIAKAVALNQEASAGRSGECGWETNWGLFFTLKFAIAMTSADGLKKKLAIQVGLFLGCKNDKLIQPQPTLMIALPNPQVVDITEASDVGTKSKISINMKFFDNFPAFDLADNHLAIGSSLDLALNADAEWLTGAKGSASLQIAFPYPPTKAPTGFTLSLVVAAGSLVQTAAQNAMDKYDDARVGVLAALSAGMKQLSKEGVSKHAKAAFEATEEKSVHDRAMHTILGVDKHKQAILQAHGAQAKNNRADPLVEYGGSMAFMTCLWWPCLGQD